MLPVIAAILVFACKIAADAEQGSSPSRDVKAGDAVNAKDVSRGEIIETQEGTAGITVKTDSESTEKGKNLFDSKCSFCHDAFSTETTVGPGLKGVLKSPKLPVSKKPATPENIASQIRNPYRDMPSFSYLPEEDILNIIAYLNTL